MENERGPEEIIQELENLEVTELDDKDLEGVSGGAEGNTNCGCTNTNCPCGEEEILN